MGLVYITKYRVSKNSEADSFPRNFNEETWQIDAFSIKWNTNFIIFPFLAC